MPLGTCRMEAATRPGSPARLPRSATGGLPAPTLAKALASPPLLSCLLLPRPLHPVLCSPLGPCRLLSGGRWGGQGVCGRRNGTAGRRVSGARSGAVGQQGALTRAKCLIFTQTSLSHLEGRGSLQGGGQGWGQGWQAECPTRAWGFAKVSDQTGDGPGQNEIWGFSGMGSPGLGPEAFVAIFSVLPTPLCCLVCPSVPPEA